MQRIYCSIVVASLVLASCVGSRGSKQESGTTYRHVEYSPEIEELRDKLSENWRITTYDSGRVDLTTPIPSPMFRLEIKSMAMMALAEGLESKNNENGVVTRRKDPTLLGSETTTITSEEAKSPATQARDRKEYLLLDLYPRELAEEVHQKLLTYIAKQRLRGDQLPREYDNGKYYAVFWDKSPDRRSVSTNNEKERKNNVEQIVTEHMKFLPAVFSLKNGHMPQPLTK